MRDTNLTEYAHFYLSFSIIMIGFAVLLLFFVQDKDITPTAMLIADTPRCQDGTSIGDCSESSIGNSCTMTRGGPDLRFSSRCYD